jgi:vitamin B12/bleomycin/antimicrobial peptide transport system ATP-binding/permease protein
MIGTGDSSTPSAAKDLSGFVHDIGTFIVIIAALLALTVANTFLQERLKFRLREWITRHLLVEWLKPLRVYQLSFAGEYGHNPDQRIQEDTRLLGDYSADLGCGIVYSLLQIVAFVGVLWALSAQVTFQVAGYDIAIPGYMVWCALAYALIGSGLTWLVGRPLIALNVERYAREAEFRFALVRVNESGESIALHGGEKDEQQHLEAALAAVVECGGYLPRSPTSPGSHRAPAGCRSSFRYSWPHRPISAAA